MEILRNIAYVLFTLFVLRTLAFLWNHWLKAKLLDRKCKPIVLMEDNKKTLSLSVFQHKDIDMDASNYANELDRISEQSGVFKQYDLDPFKNPFLVTSFGHADEKMSYNKKIERYRNELFLKNKRKYKSKLLCKRFCPLQLIISNNGSAPCGKMNISISFSLPCVYPSTLMKKTLILVYASLNIRMRITITIILFMM